MGREQPSIAQVLPLWQTLLLVAGAVALYVVALIFPVPNVWPSREVMGIVVGCALLLLPGRGLGAANPVWVNVLTALGSAALAVSLFWPCRWMGDSWVAYLFALGFGLWAVVGVACAVVRWPMRGDGAPNVTRPG